MKRSSAALTKGPLIRGIIFYTIPIILTSILQLLFNAADLVIVGRFCGSMYVGAVGATTSVTHLIVQLFIGLSIGAGVAVAQAYGRQNETEIHRAVHTAIPMAIVCGIIITVIGVALAEPLLVLMDSPENLLPLSAIYMRIYFGGIVFTMLYNFAAAILRAAGDTKSPLVYLTIAGIINVVLNIIFVTLFDMDVDGVALATVISQAVSAILTTWALMRRTDACRLVLREMKFYGKELGKIIAIGLPAGINSSLFAISNVIIQSSINSFGDIAVAGSAAASNIEGFLSTSVNAFNHTALNYAGQNLGARNFKRIKQMVLVCLVMVFVFGFAAGQIMYFFGEPLLSIYITDSAESIACGITRMTYLTLFYCVAGLMDVSTGALRGMGVSTVPMVISVLGVCGFRIAWIYTIFRVEEFHSLASLFASYPISWAITFVFQISAFAIVYKIKKKKAMLEGAVI